MKTSDTNKATARPWRVQDEGSQVVIVSNAGKRLPAICQMYAPQGKVSRKRAKLIVDAVNQHDALNEYREACDMFIAFLRSLPQGWLGKTVGDIGLLNEAYLKQASAQSALAKVRESGVES